MQGGYGLLVAEACGYPAALVAEARHLQRAVRACFPTLLLTDGGGAGASGGHGQGQGQGGVDQSHKVALSAVLAAGPPSHHALSHTHSLSPLSLLSLSSLSL